MEDAMISWLGVLILATVVGLAFILEWIVDETEGWNRVGLAFIIICCIVATLLAFILEVTSFRCIR